MLRDALAHVAAGDQEHPVGTLERGVEGGGVGVVGDGGAHPEVGEGGELRHVAPGGDDVVGADAAAQQGLDGEAAELAGGSGDDDGHGGSFRWLPVGERWPGGRVGCVVVARANRVEAGMLPGS